MRRSKWMTGLACATLLVVAVTTTHAQEAAPVRGHKIQLAILLDTSGSMSGLIDQAKAQLWSIVNEFATTKKDGKVPDFEVALYEYGNDGLSSENGYVRRILPLTTDLDKVSEELFALRTNGGSEYCGTVIKAATEELAWSASNEDLKVVFIAGNEPFTQGSIDFRKACPEAIGKGVIVNTIFCGDRAQGIETHWRDGATLADGKYMNIDGNAKAVHIAAPQDDEIARLATRMNDTYVAYGARGRVGKANQEAQDANVSSLSRKGAVQRALSKSSAHYRNAEWDLVDALKEETVKLEDVKDAELPEEMKKMSVEERKAYVETKAKEREALQKEIGELNAARKTFVAAEMKKRANQDENTLENAIIEAVRTQAQAKKFISAE